MDPPMKNLKTAPPGYTKLKVTLKLATHRLKLQKAKKSELVQKTRKEIANLIKEGKFEKARLKVEHVIK